MTEQKNNKKSSMGIGCVLIRIAAVLFCLVVVSTYLMSGLFARYVAKGTGSDSARVAGFDVVVDGPDDVEIIYGGDNNGPYTITLDNKSEVAVSYSAKVVVSEVDFGIDVTLNGETLNTNDSTELNFENIGYAAPDTTATSDLTFEVTDWGEFTKNVEGAKREDSVDFVVYLTVTQVD